MRKLLSSFLNLSLIVPWNALAQIQAKNNNYVQIAQEEIAKVIQPDAKRIAILEPQPTCNASLSQAGVKDLISKLDETLNNEFGTAIKMNPELYQKYKDNLEKFGQKEGDCDKGCLDSILNMTSNLVEYLPADVHEKDIKEGSPILALVKTDTNKSEYLNDRFLFTKFPRYLDDIKDVEKRFTEMHNVDHLKLNYRENPQWKERPEGKEYDRNVQLKKDSEAYAKELQDIYSKILDEKAKENVLDPEKRKQVIEAGMNYTGNAKVKNTYFSDLGKNFGLSDQELAVRDYEKMRELRLGQLAEPMNKVKEDVKFSQKGYGLEDAQELLTVAEAEKAKLDAEIKEQRDAYNKHQGKYPDAKLLNESKLLGTRIGSLKFNIKNINDLDENYNVSKKLLETENASLTFDQYAHGFPGYSSDFAFKEIYQLERGAGRGEIPSGLTVASKLYPMFKFYKKEHFIHSVFPKMIGCTQINLTARQCGDAGIKVQTRLCYHEESVSPLASYSECTLEGDKHSFNISSQDGSGAVSTCADTLKLLNKVEAEVERMVRQGYRVYGVEIEAMASYSHSSSSTDPDAKNIALAKKRLDAINQCKEDPSAKMVFDKVEQGINQANTGDPIHIKTTYNSKTPSGPTQTSDDSKLRDKLITPENQAEMFNELKTHYEKLHTTFPYKEPKDIANFTNLYQAKFAPYQGYKVVVYASQPDKKIRCDDLAADGRPKTAAERALDQKEKNVNGTQVRENK